MSINIRKTQGAQGERPSFEFTSKQNIVGSLGFNDNGFTFEGQVGQRFMVPVVSTTTMELDARNANSWQIDLKGNVTSFGFKHMIIGHYTIKFVQDSVGARTVAFASAFKWGDGTAPDFSLQVANEVFIMTFFSDGTNIYDTTTSSTFTGDNGIDLYVDDFGAVGDGVTDDTVAIQAALTYARANGINNVIFSEKEYVSAGDLEFQGLDIIGNGATMLRSGLGRFYVYGSIAEPVNLPSDATLGDSWVAVTHAFALTVEAGDLVKVFSDEHCQPTVAEEVAYGEIHEIKVVDTTNDRVKFADFLFHTYPTSETGRISKITDGTGSMKDFTIRYANDTIIDEIGIYLWYARDYVIDNVTIENSYSESLLINHCYKPVINVHTYNSTQNGLGYGISIVGATMYADITGTLFGHRHAITTGSTESGSVAASAGGISWESHVHDVVATGRDNAVAGDSTFDTHHSSGSITFTNCTAIGGTTVDYVDATTWDVGTAYIIGDYVRRFDQLYVCVAGDTGTDPATDYQITVWRWIIKGNHTGFGHRGLKMTILNCRVIGGGVGVATTSQGSAELLYIDGLYVEDNKVGILGNIDTVCDTIIIKNLIHNCQFNSYLTTAVVIACGVDELFIDGITAINSIPYHMQAVPAAKTPGPVQVNNVTCTRDANIGGSGDYALRLDPRTGLSAVDHTFNNIHVKNFNGLFRVWPDAGVGSVENLIFNNITIYGATRQDLLLEQHCEKVVLNNYVNDTNAINALVQTVNGIDEFIFNGSYTGQSLFYISNPATGFVNTYTAHGVTLASTDFVANQYGTNDYPIEVEGRNIWKGRRVPEGNVTANISTTYMNKVTGLSYVKVTGTGNTGWQQVSYFAV